MNQKFIRVWGLSFLIFGIFFSNISNADFPKFPICVDDASQRSPDISGDIVVWHDRRNENGDIYGKYLSTNTEFPICTEPNVQYGPKISGNIVIWLDNRNRNGGTSAPYDIYGYDLNAETEFVIAEDLNFAYDDHIAIDCNMIVYSARPIDSGYWDLYGYDLDKKDEFLIYEPVAQ